MEKIRITYQTALADAYLSETWKFRMTVQHDEMGF